MRLFESRSGRVALGASYRYTLYTHCGIDGVVDFDGSLWDHAGPGAPDDGSGNPPDGLGNPLDHGTLRLVDADTAEFTAERGATIRYRRRATPKAVQMCA